MEKQDIIYGITDSGFEFTIERTALDDMRLIDALCESENDNPLSISKVIQLMLGKNQKEKLYKHIAEENGRVPIDKLVNEVKDIFAKSGDSVKN